MSENEPAKQAGASGEKQIKPQKIYIKDSSFESPNSPQVFSSDWKPALGIELSTLSRQHGEETYEVAQHLTVTMKNGDSTAYLAEVVQAGIFNIAGFNEQELEFALNVHCMRILYPYACAAISDLVSRGGFPQVVLAPISFRQAYMQRLASEKQPQAESGAN